MDDAITGPTPRKLDADDGHRMIGTDILGKEDRVEPTDGDVIEMAPTGQGHAATMSALTQALVLACRGRAIAGPHSSVRPDRLNVPERAGF